MSKYIVLFLLIVLAFAHFGNSAASTTPNDLGPVPHPARPDKQESVTQPSLSDKMPLPPKASEVALTGWLTIIWGDGEPGSETAVTTYHLIDDSGQVTEMVLNEMLVQVAGGILSLNRQRVIAEGVWASAPAVNTGPDQFLVQSIQPITALNELEASGDISGVTGSQPWVSLLCKFADVADEPNPRPYFQEMFGSDYPGLDHYWREQSYGLINVEGSDAFGWYILPESKSYYVYDRVRILPSWDMKWVTGLVCRIPPALMGKRMTTSGM